MNRVRDFRSELKRVFRSGSPLRVFRSGAPLRVFRSGSVARGLARGVTLVEVLIVVAIMSMIAAGVVVAVIPKFNEARVKTAENNAREIRNAVARWKSTRGGEDCPTVSQLVQDKEIDSASKTDDPWGSVYKIQCAEDEVIVSSSGPDKKDGTQDDISVPKMAQR